MTVASYSALIRNMSLRPGVHRPISTLPTFRRIGATNTETDAFLLSRCSQPHHHPSLASTSSNANVDNRNFRTKAGYGDAAVPHTRVTDAEHVKDFSEMPGPRPLPLIGNFLDLFRHKDFDPKNFYKFWASFMDQRGTIVKLKMPGAPIMVASKNPDDIEAFLKSTLHNPIRYGFGSLKQVRVAAKDNYFNKKSGLLPENGEEWWRLRSRVQVPLLRPRNVAMYLPAVDGATNMFMDRIDLLQAETGQVPEDFLKELYKWALECIGLVALNRELGCLDPHVAPDSVPMQLIRHVNDIFAALNATEMGPHTWKLFRTSAYVQLEKSHAAFLELAAEAIKEAELGLEAAKAKGDPDRGLTIMETFLNTEGLTRSDVATMVLDMLFAGVDTVGWCFFRKYFIRNDNIFGTRDLDPAQMRGFRDHRKPLRDLE